MAGMMSFQKQGFGLWLLSAAMAMCGAMLALPAPLSGAAAAAGSRAPGIRPAAAASRVQSIQEQGHLRLVKSNGFNKLYEEGRGAGTFPNVTLRATVTIVSTSEGSFSFNAYLPGGVLSGRGHTHDYQRGSIDYYSGTLHISGGTGRYSHAHGNQALKGAVSRPSYALTLEVRGKLSF
jgi:hypothetical protein